MPEKTYSLPLPHRLPDSMRRSAHAMYPDIFNYQLTADAYNRLWENMKEAPHYLITENMLPVPATYGRYAWKQVKASVGYTNYCHPIRTQMAMRKLLYFGYLNGLNKDALLSFSDAFLAMYPLPLAYLTACQKERNNETSQWLQTELMQFYNQHHRVLNGRARDSHQPASGYFGESYASHYYATADNLCTFAKLDPQSPNLLHCKGLMLNQTLSGSTLRKRLIDVKLQKLSHDFQVISHPKTSKPAGVLGAVSQWQQLLWKNTSTEKAQHEYKEAGWSDLITQADLLLSFWPSLCVEQHDFYVSLYGGFAIKLVEQLEKDKAKEYFEKAYCVIQSLTFSVARHHLDTFFLMDEDAYALIEKHTTLHEQWLGHLYTTVIQTKNDALVVMHAIRVIVDNPSLIEEKNLVRFIDMTLHKITPSHTIDLLERLYQHAPELACMYLKNNPQLLNAVSKNTAFAKYYAEKLASDPTFTFNPFKLLSTPSRLFAPRKTDTLGTLKQLDSDIHKHSQEAASLSFSDHVAMKQWQEAWAIIVYRQEHKLPIKAIKQKDKNKLAEVFYAEALLVNQQAQTAVAQKSDYQHVELLYVQSLNLLTNVLWLNDIDKYRCDLNHTRCLLMDMMQKADEHTSSVSMLRVDKAFELLTHIHDTPCSEIDTDLPPIVSRWYDLGIICLYQACLIDNPNSSVVDATHAQLVNQTVSRLCVFLQNAIEFRTNQKDEDLIDPLENREKLAFAHFLLAECVQYFECVELDVMHHYRKACELVPKQPFYWLRAGEVSQTHSIEQEKGLALLQATGLNATDYMHWFDERWQVESKRTYHVSIPVVDLQEESYLSQVMRWFS